MAPPILFESKALTAALALPADERKKIATSLSVGEGIKAAVGTSVVWLPTIAYLNYGKSKYSEFFQKRFNTSAKTAAVIMPIIFAYGMVSEQVNSRLANPTAYASEDSGFVRDLPLYKQVGNYVYHHPFRTVFWMGLPGVVAIYIAEGRDKSLTLSQRIMHTRVLGQFYVISIMIMMLTF